MYKVKLGDGRTIGLRMIRDGSCRQGRGRERRLVVVVVVAAAVGFLGGEMTKRDKRLGLINKGNFCPFNGHPYEKMHFTPLNSTRICNLVSNFKL